MIHSRARTLLTQKMLGQGQLELFAEGSSPCIIAFHGFGGTAAELRPLLERTADAGFAVHAALLPGHGARVEELQEKTFDAWVAAGRQWAVATAKRHDRFVLLGFSLGSLIAMQIASEKPDGIAGLVVLSNALTLAASTRLPLALLARLGRRMPDVYLLKPFAGNLMDKSAMAALVTYDRHPLRAALEVYRAGARVRGVVARIDCPTLILHGRRDLVCPWQNATWLAKRLPSPDVRVRIFDKSAHVLACDGDREEVAGDVVAFVRRCVAESAETRGVNQRVME
jgi:carboxylesterase